MGTGRPTILYKFYTNFTSHLRPRPGRRVRVRVERGVRRRGRVAVSSREPTVGGVRGATRGARRSVLDRGVWDFGCGDQGKVFRHRVPDQVFRPRARVQSIRVGEENHRPRHRRARRRRRSSVVAVRGFTLRLSFRSSLPYF